MKKFIPVALAGIILILCVFGAGYVLKKDISLNAELSKTKQLFTKIEERLTESQAEKGKAVKEAEKLQADAISYLALNTKLREENEKFQKRLEEAQKIIETSESGLEREKQEREKNLEKLTRETNAKIKEAVKQKEAFEKRLIALEKKFVNERGVYHYNLAVAFTRAGMYAEAEAEYAKSLQYEEGNADAHYNLALLYQNTLKNPGKAVEHYKRYLELRPDSKDSREVEDTLNRLQNMTERK